MSMAQVDLTDSSVQQEFSQFPALAHGPVLWDQHRCGTGFPAGQVHSRNKKTLRQPFLELPQRFMRTIDFVGNAYDFCTEIANASVCRSTNSSPFLISASAL